MLDKAVGVLHTIAESPCGLADLCERTGLPRATAHRLAAGLEVHRLLARDDEGRWRLGPALVELAGHVNDPLLAAGAAVLPRLREITGESVQLYRREGKSYFTLAVGCTGGRHRSVALVEHLGRGLTEHGYRVQIQHRDVQR